MEFFNKFNLKIKYFNIMLSIERIRDYASLFISIASSYIYFTNGSYKIITHYIAMYLLSDLFITKQYDTYIHHTIGLMLYSFVYMNNL